MEGVGSSSSQHNLSHQQENGNSHEYPNSLPFMSQGHNRFSPTVPQNIFYQNTNSVSLIVTPASGITTGTADKTTITHRFDNRLHFDVTVLGLPFQESFIRVPFTRSVKRSVPATGLCCYLNLSFELRGAETGNIREYACQRCKNKISRDLVSLSRVDFTEKQDLIALENGKARISFRFTCYPSHGDDGAGVSTDKEYIIQAVLRDELQIVIARYEVPNRFKIARNANGPVDNRWKSRGSRTSPLSQDGACQAGGLFGAAAFVPVTPPPDFNLSTLQPFAYGGTPDPHAFLLPPANVAENPAPLPLLPALQDQYSHKYSYLPEATSMDVGPINGTGVVGLQEMPRNSNSIETRTTDIMVQRDLIPSGVLENETRANETVNKHPPRDLQVPPGICSTLPLGISSFTTQQSLHVPYPTPFIGVVSNPPIRVVEDIIPGVVEPTKETLQVIPPFRLHGRMDWACSHETGTTPAPIPNADMISATGSIVPTIPPELLSPSATTTLPSTEGSSNGSDHGITCSSSQQSTTQELNPCAEYVAPSKGPMSGGLEVTIVGTNFPYTLPLRVYFSTQLAPITRKTRETIRCLVPAASSPGTVDVRILVEHPESAPEIDCRMAKFTYEDERMTELMVHVKYIASRRNPALWESTMTSMQRVVETAMEQVPKDLEPDASKGLLSRDHGQLEEIAIQILSSYSTYYDWKEAVSYPNEYGQTLAHLAGTLGYIRLLEQLISWEIDLSVRDTTGATAFHFACLYDYPECVSLLTRHGANQQIRDEPGQKTYAMTWPGDSGASFNGTVDDSSDLASEYTASITDGEEMLGTERALDPKWLREKRRFDLRQAKLLECGANSLGSADTDLKPRPPTTDPTETGAVEVQALGVSARGSPNRQQAISSGSNAHAETSYSHTNAIKGPLRTSGDPDPLSALPPGQESSAFDNLTPLGASRSRNEMHESAQIEDSRPTADSLLLQEVVPARGRSILDQTTTLPTVVLSGPHDEGHITQELENVEAGATVQSTEIVFQGSSQQVLTMPIPASQVSPGTGIPVVSPERPTPTIPFAITASLTQAPMRPNQTPNFAKKPVGTLLHSLLGTKQNNTPGTHPTGLVHDAPNFSLREPCEFREMTLGCRFITTDQWLTTRVDTSWTVSQIKLHILTKLLGARRDQLTALNYPSESRIESTSSSHSARVREVKTIATSNQSSVIFALHESSNFESLNHSPNPHYQLPPWPVERQIFDAKPDIPSLASFAQSAPITHQAHLGSETDTQNTDSPVPHRGFGAATAPPVMTSLNVNDINKEDLLDELMDRLETEAKELVYKVTDKYCLMRFLGGDILDDRMTLTECQLRPFELLEMQEKTRVLQIPRHVYLDAYWESPVEVRTHDRGGLQGMKGIKRLVRMKREEVVQQELQRAFVAEFMSNPIGEAHKGPRSAASIILPWRNTPEARSREHEKKRRELLQKVEQAETKRENREIKEAATERWKERLAIVEGHQLNVWKNRNDDHPEQSWDLRCAIEVSVPKRRKLPEFPSGSVATAYAALKKSNTLNVIRVKEKQKCNTGDRAKDKQPHYHLHIRFSIPSSSVNPTRDQAGVASKVITKLKKWLKREDKTSNVPNSASFAKLPSNSSDPFIQGAGIGTSALEGAGSATLVLRLPDERSLENLSRVIHRSAGKYPLNQECKRAGVLSQREVHHPGPVDAITATKQETKFYTYPEWRKRILQKCVAPGRHGSRWKAGLNPNTWACDLPRKMQGWWENDEEENGEEMLGDEENEPVSMTSDAEWEGWRRELALEGPIRPGSPGLKAAQEDNPWTSDRTLSPNRTILCGQTRSYREDMRC